MKKKILVITLIILFSVNSYSQFRWEVSGGITSTTLQINNNDDTFFARIFTKK